MNVFLELHNSALYIYITFTSIIINIIEICKSCITTTQLFSYYMKSAYFRKKKNATQHQLRISLLDKKMSSCHSRRHIIHDSCVWGAMY